MMAAVDTKSTFLSVAVAAALALAPLSAQKAFRAKTADKYPAKQRQGDLVVAVKPFVSAKDQQAAFGGARPYSHGVAPVLLVFTNRGTNTYSLEKMKARLIMADRDGLEPLTGSDLAGFNPQGHQPTRRNVPGVPGLGKTRVKKGPLNRPKILESEFRAPILTPKSTASGFLFFLTGTDQSLAGASSYITGIYDITNGKDLFYFEIPVGKLP